MAYQIRSAVRLARRFSTGEGSIRVFGHKIPDTDAICSAIVRAWELEQHGKPATAFRLGELNNETKYVLETVGLAEPPILPSLKPGDVVAIVDTNNPQELPDDLFKASIDSIVDHHKLAGLTTSGPIDVDIRPLCSAGSILFVRMKDAGIKPTSTMAALMLSCILSDSLEFRSPTTTEIDKVLAVELAGICNIDVPSHAAGMFAAKADISHLNPTEVVMMDSKVYDLGGYGKINMRVSVVETTDPAMALEQIDALREAFETVAAEEEGVDDVAFFVVDILNEEATYVSSSPTSAELVKSAWGVSLDKNGLVVLPGVLSRKKQIMPALEAAMAQRME
jgi:manganese-dependent inorganic pyrophosphatase